MEEEVVSIETIDIGKEILNTINALCNKLFQSINKNVFPELDKLIFLDSDVAEKNHLKEIIGTDFNHGLLVVAEFLLCAFVVYYAVRRFTAFYSGKDVESPYQFFVKAVVIGIFTGYSLTICSRSTFNHSRNHKCNMQYRKRKTKSKDFFFSSNR